MKTLKPHLAAALRTVLAAGGIGKPIDEIALNKALFDKAGVEVVGAAEDGREALHVIEETGPDVVVMDVRMPVRNGIEATRLLAGPDVADPVKVLVVTTFNLDTIALKSGSRWWNWYTKPIWSRRTAAR